MVQYLIAEAREFCGAVAKESRLAWLQAFEACTGKIAQSKYDQALAILRAWSFVQRRALEGSVELHRADWTAFIAIWRPPHVA
jgi:hypothetical protein